MPLVTDDEEYPQEDSQSQPEAIEQFAQKTVQTGVSFKMMISNVASWLSRRKLPDSTKKGLKEFGQEIWYSKSDLQRRRQSRNNPSTKWTSTPFKSFGPAKEKKKGKL